MNDTLRHMERTKQCTRCGEVKPLSEFGKHRVSPDGHAYQCKECGKERAKAYRASPMGVFIGLRGRQTFYKRHGDKREKPFLLEKDSFLEWYGVQPQVLVILFIFNGPSPVFVNLNSQTLLVFGPTLPKS